MTNPCPSCGHLVAATSRFCPICGSLIQVSGGNVMSGSTLPLGPRCIQPVGMLVPHRCGQLAQSRCRVCGQAFCDQHLSIEPQGPICAACARGEQLGYADDFSGTDLAYFDRVSEDDRGEDFADLS